MKQDRTSVERFQLERLCRWSTETLPNGFRVFLSLQFDPKHGPVLQCILARESEKSGVSFTLDHICASDDPYAMVTDAVTKICLANPPANENEKPKETVQ